MELVELSGNPDLIMDLQCSYNRLEGQMMAEEEGEGHVVEKITPDSLLSPTREAAVQPEGRSR